MSGEEEYDNDDFNEDLIYQQMFEAIAEELHFDDNSEEETPNLDSLSLTKEQVIQIRKGGIQTFKDIMQSRFRQNIVEESQQEQNLIVPQIEPQEDQQKQQCVTILIEDNNLQTEQEQFAKFQQEINQIQDDRDAQEEGKNVEKSQNIIQHQSQVDELPHQMNKIDEEMEQEQQDVKINSSENEQQIEDINEDQYEQQQHLLNVIEENAQTQDYSLDIRIDENKNYTHFEAEREHAFDQNSQGLKISSENISPIAKKNKQREQYFSNANQQSSYSAQNSSYKALNTPQTTKSDEKKQSKKSNKIINDIFSLSGVKVGQVKSMTPMGYNSVSMTASNFNNRKEFNQSALTQYQYDSISSLRPRSPHEQDTAIARLYRKHEDVKQKIQKLQQEKITQELSTLKSHPQIAKGSQKILSKQNYQKPSATSSILFKEQKEKRQQLQEEKQKEKIEKELEKCTFHPQLVTKAYEEYPAQTRSVNEFYEQQQKWLQNKDKNILSSQIDSIQKELSETTFHPKINKLSSCQIRNVKVEEKLFQDQEKVLEKRKKMAEQNQPLFKPVILPKSQELAKKRREKEFIPCYEISSKFN